MLIQIISLILSILASAGFITLVTIKSVRKKAAEEAESISIDNDSKRVEGYIIIIDDLNKRIAAVLENMRKLEEELNSAKQKNISLYNDYLEVKAENERLKQEINTLKSIQYEKK